MVNFETKAIKATLELYKRSIKKVKFCAGGTWYEAGKPKMTIVNNSMIIDVDADISGKYPNGTTVTGVQYIDSDGEVFISETGVTTPVKPRKTGIYFRLKLDF
ncbi:MAG: hypothetical protein RR310_08600 [Eubacterium sp.]